MADKRQKAEQLLQLKESLLEQGENQVSVAEKSTFRVSLTNHERIASNIKNSQESKSREPSNNSPKKATAETSAPGKVLPTPRPQILIPMQEPKPLLTRCEISETLDSKTLNSKPSQIETKAPNVSPVTPRNIVSTLLAVGDLKLKPKMPGITPKEGVFGVEDLNFSPMTDKDTDQEVEEIICRNDLKEFVRQEKNLKLQTPKIQIQEPEIDGNFSPERKKSEHQQSSTLENKHPESPSPCFGETSLVNDTDTLLIQIKDQIDDYPNLKKSIFDANENIQDIFENLLNKDEQINEILMRLETKNLEPEISKPEALETPKVELDLAALKIEIHKIQAENDLKLLEISEKQENLRPEIPSTWEKLVTDNSDNISSLKFRSDEILGRMKNLEAENETLSKKISSLNFEYSRENSKLQEQVKVCQMQLDQMLEENSKIIG